MNIESILKTIDPIISEALNLAIDEKEISVEQAVELFDTSGLEMNLLTSVGDELRRRACGNVVTYVINRNVNFTNVCIKRCGFCAFSRDFRQEEGYFLPVEEVVRRAVEAHRLGATEICIQAGLAPNMDGSLYPDICKAIKREIPDIHIHGFSPEEVLYGARMSNNSVRDFLSWLKESGVGSLPGTSAEILDQEVRDLISPGRISVNDWIDVIKTAHSLDIPTTSTIMYGHIESNFHKANHIDILRKMQKETGGFTEFVPLSFVYQEAPMHSRSNLKNMREAGAGATDIVKMYSISRLMLHNYVKNIQVSWVKEGAKMSQFLLCAGANDFGGTLINESISTSAGSIHGQIMRPREIRTQIKGLGRIPAQRNTLYEILQVTSGDEDDCQTELDQVNADDFGSYRELIKLDKYRYKHSLRHHN
ncbi:MAG: 5-amino-6-(D-ribitylamino)uracil--L-tyrosine 4-hydroxyphenyl transferase CofH [Nitrososphaeraceae archaeon]